MTVRSVLTDCIPYFRIALLVAAVVSILTWVNPHRAYWIGPRPIAAYASTHAFHINFGGEFHDFLMAWVNSGGMPRFDIHRYDPGELYPEIWNVHGERGTVVIPYGLVILASCVAWMGPLKRSWRRWRGDAPGVCVCGYDLTGNVSGICSECGRGVPQSQPCI